MEISLNSILARMEGMYDRMPKVEKRIADYISAHTGQVPLLTVEQIAELSGGSVATVSRFVKKLGYASLRAFKVDLARTGSAGEDELFQGIGSDDTDREVLRKTFQGNRQSLEDSLALLADLFHNQVRQDRSRGSAEPTMSRGRIESLYDFQGFLSPFKGHPDHLGYLQNRLLLQVVDVLIDYPVSQRILKPFIGQLDQE